MKTFFTFCFISFLFIVGVNAQSKLMGKATDAETGEPVIFGTVMVYQDDKLITGTETDFYGFYEIENLQAGIYDIVFSYTGYQNYKVVQVVIIPNQTTRLNAQLSSNLIYGGCGYMPRNPVDISVDKTTQGFKFNSDQLRNMGYR